MSAESSEAPGCPVLRKGYCYLPLYEQIYCARGEMENRIKEQQLDLFADRTSTRSFRANQPRLLMTSFAYVLVEGLRRRALQSRSPG